MSDEYPEVTTGSIAARQNREAMQRERQSSLAAPSGSASDLDATDFGWNNPDEECEPDFTLDDLEWSEAYE